MSFHKILESEGYKLFCHTDTLYPTENVSVKQKKKQMEQILVAYQLHIYNVHLYYSNTMQKFVDINVCNACSCIMLNCTI